MDILNLIGRKNPLFIEDIDNINDHLVDIVQESRFLVIGGAGSIGKAVVKEIFKRNPLALHVVDISENNLVELVRDIRSSLGYIDGSFKTFSIDCGGDEFLSLINANKNYDYILNLSALKHVRSEKDPYTLMRLIQVNILNTIDTIKIAREIGCKKYFCVSTDKATNPVNMMGASKRIMEYFLFRESEKISISTARFANVAFSDGSLLHSFNQRFFLKQPIAAPNDVKRYFMTPSESGELCLLSCLFGENRDIFFPKQNEDFDLIKFSDIAIRYIENMGFKPYLCKSEEEAREKSSKLIDSNYWPCLFSKSNTSGEKDFEEFYTKTEKLDMHKFSKIGIIKNDPTYDGRALTKFLEDVKALHKRKLWSKKELVDIFQEIVPNFHHLEKEKNLDEKM